ncbi:MAG: hypothetical protein IJX08_06245, partial [Clostridia bacterium]|nr:hypothetical protein [Clostridia bacterium]
RAHARTREEREQELARRRKLINDFGGQGVVLLSDNQMESLLDLLSVEEFDKYVPIVAECELSGKHFTKKTHYQAILDMAEEDRKVHRG